MSMRQRKRHLTRRFIITPAWVRLSSAIKFFRYRGLVSNFYSLRFEQGKK